MSIISSDEADGAPPAPVSAPRLALAAERGRLLDAAAGAVREVASTPLARAVLLQQLLATVLPDEAFTVLLGAIRVTRVDGTSTISRDPRGADGVERATHAWLEDGEGRVHDVAIVSELSAAGLAPDLEHRVDGAGRTFQRAGLSFHYEEIAELEILHLADAGDWVRAALLLAATGELPPEGEPLACPLAVRWRTGV